MSLKPTTSKGTESGQHEIIVLVLLCSTAQAMCTPLSVVIPRASWDLFCIRKQVAMGKEYMYVLGHNYSTYGVGLLSV